MVGTNPTLVDRICDDQVSLSIVLVAVLTALRRRIPKYVQSHWHD